MKKVHELTVDTKGYVRVRHDGYFKSIDNLVDFFNAENYVLIEGKKVNYRVSKYEIGNKAIQKYLKEKTKE